MEFANPDALNPHDEAIQKERRKTLRSALQQLHKTCEEVITLFYLQQLSYSEISEQLDITVNTVGSRLSKCLNKLRKEILKHPLFERIRS